MADFRCSGCEIVLTSRNCTTKPYLCDSCYGHAVRRAEHRRGERERYRSRCGLDTCENCGSSRNARSVRKYETRNGNDVLIQCSDCK